MYNKNSFFSSLPFTCNVRLSLTLFLCFCEWIVLFSKRVVRTMGFCECEFTSNLPGQKLQPFNNFNWKLSTKIHLNAPASVAMFIFLFARFLCSADFPSPVCVCGIWDAIIKKCSMFNKCVVTRERSSYDKLYAIDDVPTNANVCVCEWAWRG